MNGDSFLEVDLEQLIRFHAARQALATLAVVRVPEASRYGTVRTAADGRVVGFSEKAESKEGGLINGGVYVFDRAILDHIPPGAASLEKDILPRILSRKVYAQEQCGMFIDIGIPDDYARAQVLCQQLHETASRR
jgi:NDP-sugar pyrophosphorylase family protein